MIHSELRFVKTINEFSDLSEKKGIGTLGEKALHAILKLYYDENKDHHEIEVCDFVADIKYGNKITEIQTGSFERLNKKLEKYLDSYDVTVVYPVAHKKNIVWIDPESGNVVAKNKSNKTGTGIEFLYEVSKIKSYINCKKLSFDILLLDIDEYKLLDGYGPDKKRRCTKLYKMPVSLSGWLTVKGAEDIKKLLPTEITDGRFTFADFEKITRLKGRKARYSLNALIEYGLIKAVGKSGRSVIYENAN